MKIIIYCLTHFVKLLYNGNMIVEAIDQIKSLLAIRGVTVKKLAEMITESTGKICTPSALSNKLRRGTITYNEVIRISELLGFKIRYDFEPY